MSLFSIRIVCAPRLQHVGLGEFASSISMLCFSSDGTLFGFGGHRVHAFDANTGKHVRSCDLPESFSNVCWEPEDAIMARLRTISDNGGARSVSLSDIPSVPNTPIIPGDRAAESIVLDEQVLIPEKEVPGKMLDFTRGADPTNDAPVQLP